MKATIADVFDILNTNHWQVKYDYQIKMAGYVDENEWSIYVNPLWGDRFLTLIHECLHIRYPSWSELAIEDSAKHLIKIITPNAIKLLFVYLERTLK